MSCRINVLTFSILTIHIYVLNQQFTNFHKVFSKKYLHFPFQVFLGVNVTSKFKMPKQISEIFLILPKYDGNSIFLNTFITSCQHSVWLLTSKMFFWFFILKTSYVVEQLNLSNLYIWDEIKKSFR